MADRWQHAQHTGLYLSEDEARFYFRQFITAVAYCHAHSVAHRWAPRPCCDTQSGTAGFARHGEIILMLYLHNRPPDGTRTTASCTAP